MAGNAGATLDDVLLVWLVATVIRMAVWIATVILDWQSRRRRGARWGPLVSFQEWGHSRVTTLERRRDQRRTVREKAVFSHGHDRRRL